ncbi:hypothetical protein M5E89_08195 [Acidaminococcus intestini]|nr:hypothetical protein M5E89_08195 [Acidaminococcus intestini]
MGKVGFLTEACFPDLEKVLKNWLMGRTPSKNAACSSFPFGKLARLSKRSCP